MKFVVITVTAIALGFVATCCKLVADEIRDLNR